MTHVRESFGRPLALGALLVSAAAFSGACAGSTQPDPAPPPPAEATHVATQSAALSIPKPIKKLGSGLFNAAKYGSGAVAQVAGMWLVNVSQGQPATQSSLAWGGDPSRAVDGNEDGNFFDNSVTHTDLDPQPWWQVDLGGTHSVTAVTIWNRTDCCTNRLDGSIVQILDDQGNVVGGQPLATSNSAPVQALLFTPPVVGHYVRVVGQGNQQPLSLAEVEVWEQSQQHGDGVCWKKTYGRGVGTIPTECPGEDKNGALCYPACAPGYYGVGPVCWQSCPAGWTDTGAFCHHDGQIIGADNSSCPWYDKCGLTFAQGCSSCPPGYANDGCTCRIDPQDVAKNSYGRGAGNLMSCSAGLEEDAGLCYTPCAAGSNGVGPVCWDQCPADYPVACGAACASSQAACAAAVANMISAPLNAVANISEMILSFGSSAAVETGVAVAEDGAKAAATAAIKAQLKQFAKDQADSVLESTAETVATGAVTGNFDWASLDPTGVAEVVMAFNQPLCD